jgi:hypothetical protein
MSLRSRHGITALDLGKRLDLEIICVAQPSIENVMFYIALCTCLVLRNYLSLVGHTKTIICISTFII